jgi:hypothetical protein
VFSITTIQFSFKRWTSARPSCTRKRERERAYAKNSSAALGRVPSWYAPMKNAFDANGIEWIEPAAGSHISHHVGPQNLCPYRERANIWYQALSSREKYILHLIEHKFPRVGVEKRAFVLSRSVERSAHDAPTKELWPCTMPRTKVWIEWLERDQVGSEKLCTQGFFNGEYDIGRLSQANLADLAGNAVGIPVVEVINQAMMEEFLDVLSPRAID